MKLIRTHQFLLVLATGAQAGCGVKASQSETAVQAGCGRDNSPRTCLKQVSALTGTWSSDCESTGTNPLTSTLSHLTLNADGTFEKTTINYQGSDQCKNESAYSTESNAGTFAQSTSRLNEWTETNRTLRAMSKSAVDDFNRGSICKQGSWSISNANPCDIPSPIDASSITYQVTNNQLTLRHCNIISNQIICSNENRTRANR